MKKLNIVLAIVMGLLVSNCSTYSIKPDHSKNGVVNKTPKWYIEYDRETWFNYQEAASSVSPDLELAVKKSVLLAKAKLADRINGEMNNRTTITKNEAGSNDNLTVQAGSQDAVVNMIADTMVGNYIVTKSEIYSTGVKSYRAYVLIEMSKKDVEKVKADVLSRRADSQKINTKEIENTANSVLKKG
jgi:hypothetical protein